jgi:hypothetical protein
MKCLSIIWKKALLYQAMIQKYFLNYALTKLGLNTAEKVEFLEYWVPRMKDNPYNFINFAQEEYTDTAPLNITPKPDSMLRVFMVTKTLETPVSVKLQSLETFNRTGFSVVE